MEYNASVNYLECYARDLGNGSWAIYDIDTQALVTIWEAGEFPESWLNLIPAMEDSAPNVFI